MWEISGARAFADAISSKESVFFGARQVTTATALIVVDLSKLHEAVPTLEYWLRKTRAAADRTFDKLRKRGSRLPEQLVNRHKKQFKATPRGVTRALPATPPTVSAKAPPPT